MCTFSHRNELVLFARMCLLFQEEENFPNLTELVLLKDTWAIIRAQVGQA
jgi:hypothetical protein